MGSGSNPLGELAARHDEFLDFVTRRVHDRVFAEDLVHTAFARAIERTETLRDERAAVAWFYRSLRNAIVDAHRRRGAEARILEEFMSEIDGRIESCESPPPNICHCVLRIAEALKPEYVEALQSIEVDGAQVKAFAAAHGISSSNAAVRVFRAREALRRGVLATCGACARGGCTDCTCGDTEGEHAHACRGHDERH